MPFSEAIRIAVASLRSNKLRSLLTVLGILIGVSSVIAVVAITEGLDAYIAERVLELGSQSFTVQKFPDIITSREQWLEMQKRKDLNLRDLEAVREGCEACAEVGGMLQTRRDAKYGRITQENVVVMGVTENATRIGTMREITTGRSLIDDDVDRGSAVAVIGSDVADAFFPNMEPLAKEILIDGHPVRVIGVVEKKGTVFGNSQDNFMWVPISYFQKMYGNRRSVDIMIQARSMESFEPAQDQARVVMRNRRHLGFNKPDDFSVETGESVLELWQNATRGIYVVTVVVTGISLIVGGVVVMNIMLVSVTERIREIGVRKALGARRRDILRQFLVESVILSAVRRDRSAWWGRPSSPGAWPPCSATSCPPPSPRPCACGRSCWPCSCPRWWAWWRGSIPPAAPPPSIPWSRSGTNEHARPPRRRALARPLRHAGGHRHGPVRPRRLQDARGADHPGRGHGHHDRHRHERDRGRPQQVDGHADRGLRHRRHLRASLRPRREPLHGRAAAPEGPVRAGSGGAGRALPDLCRRWRPWSCPPPRTSSTAGRRSRTRSSSGTTPAYETVHDAFIERGRFLAPSDVSRGSKVAVIGSEIAETLFPYVDPVDKEITLDGIRFRVIGVMEHKGKFLNFNRDNLILIPMGSMVRASFFNFLLADVKATAPRRRWNGRRKRSARSCAGSAS